MSERLVSSLISWIPLREQWLTSFLCILCIVEPRSRGPYGHDASFASSEPWNGRKRQSQRPYTKDLKSIYFSSTQKSNPTLPKMQHPHTRSSQATKTPTTEPVLHHNLSNISSPRHSLGIEILGKGEDPRDAGEKEFRMPSRFG